MVQSSIVNDVCTQADKEGSGYNHWYCGIASDPKKRLFSDHNVAEKNSWWIYRNAEIEQNARDTEDRLLQLGFTGGEGGGDSSSTYVYAYKITNLTIE
ncbi:MAG: hypothetical protein Q8O32_01710 [bacterium]|nr:hypothetical protein [bacterium]